MKFDSKAHADWRAPLCAVLIGSGVGLALGAAYMAGGMARAASDHARASRLAAAAAGGYSDSILEREAAALDPGVLRIARRHDPFAGAAERDRQSALLAARLENAPRSGASRVPLRGGFDIALSPAAPFHLAGALETSRELECLTQAVYFEARGETPAGQAAVAQVVLNRVRHPAFPHSVCAVVFQGAGKRVGCQFSFACDGSMRRGREQAAWNRAQKIASRALSGVVMAGVGDATHFHTTNVAPNWGPRLVRTAEVGLHVFYRLGRDTGRTYAAAGRAAEAERTYASLTSAPGVSAPLEITAELHLASAVKLDKIEDFPAKAQGAAPVLAVEHAKKSASARPSAAVGEAVDAEATMVGTD